MAYPERKDSSDDDSGLVEARPPGPVLVEDERTPATAADVAGSKPPRVPPGVYATDFAPTPEPDPAGVSIANLKNRTPRLDFISFLPGATATVIIVVYLLLLIGVILAQLRT